MTKSIFLLLLLLIPCLAVSSNKLWIENTYANTGDTGKFFITLINSSPINGMNFIVQYDKGKITPISIQPLGRVLSLSGVSSSLGSTDKMNFLLFDLQAMQLSSDSGRIFEVTFIVSDSIPFPTTTGITLTEGIAADSNLSVIPFEYVNGVITINSLYAYQVAKSWNLMSIPRAVSESRIQSLFPTAESKAYTYLPKYGYVQKESLSHGVGFWIKFNNEQFVSIVGGSLATDTIVVKKGWNIIGSVTQPVRTASITSLPPNIVHSQYYGYNGSYAPADSLLPAKGYWVKASDSGKIILSSSGIALTKEQSRSMVLGEYNSISILDARGHKPTMYFGSANATIPGTNSSQFELPPPPPSGIFDARFVTGNLLEVVKEGETKIIPIFLSSVEYPISISWDLKSISSRASLLVNGKETELLSNSSIKIPNNPSMSEDDKQPIALKLTGAPNLPKEYALKQNYPNPFNPVTIIRYQLPVDANVTLKIFNVLGQEVKILVDKTVDAGYKSIEWDAGNYASGVYFYKLEATSVSDPSQTYHEVKKMVLVR